jgi:hypothetical protein
MPLTRVEGRRRRTDAEVEAIIEAVYRAQREVLRNKRLRDADGSASRIEITDGLDSRFSDFPPRKHPPT